MESTAYFAKWILLPDGSILSNGAVVVTDDTITSIGNRSTVKRSSKDRVVNLGRRLLLPGFINLHTHLEEGVFRGVLKEEHEPFLSWTLKKEKSLKTAGAEAITSTIRLGIRESLANGITTIADTSRTGLSPAVFRDEAVRNWTFHELHAEDDQAERELMADLEKRLQQPGSGRNIGLAPYAVFSLSPTMHKKIAGLAKQNNVLWACHSAESSDELQAFSEQLGDLYFYLTRKKEWLYGKTERGSMYYAITGNLIPNNGILYHCNYVGSEELSILAAKNISIVMCSQYNEMLGHKRFPLEAAMNRGINLCLGTESPILITGMDLFDELFHIKTHYPHIPAKEMINWVTRNPARALRCSNMLGTLEEGKKADIIGIRVLGDPQEETLLEELLVEEPIIDFVMVNGEEMIIGI